MQYDAPKALELGRVENLTFGTAFFGFTDDIGVGRKGFLIPVRNS